MRIYLGDLELPVAPERFDASAESGREIAELESLGEVSLHRPMRLRSFRFGGILPGEDYSFVTAGLRATPDTYVNSIEQMADQKDPVRLVISGGAKPFSLLVTVESFQWSLQAGEDNDIYYELELQEYRDFGKAAAVNTGSFAAAAASSATGNPSSKNPSAPTVYTVRKGDTLWAIAKKYLGDGSRYPELAALNSIPNPNLIFPGQQVKIP